ncbi:MAG: hypothetical protein HDR26_01180 [Lachnospiraceae bacterium]|nr:hypothetical protein [Lachnospiraceae bacterium]
MNKIKDTLIKNKKMCIGFTVLGALGLICFGLSFIIVDYWFPTFYIGAFLAICIIGSVLWIIGHRFTKKLSVWWYIMASNTLITIYSVYRIIYDTFINTGWFQGLEAVIFIVLMAPVEVAIYLVCVIFILKNRGKFR